MIEKQQNDLIEMINKKQMDVDDDISSARVIQHAASKLSIAKQTLYRSVFKRKIGIVDGE